MSKIKFKGDYSGGFVITDPSSQSFTIKIEYTLSASCDNVGTDGQDQNQATTTLYATVDGNNWEHIDSVQASVPGGGFPISQADSKTIIGSFVIQNVSDLSRFQMSVSYECDYGRNGKGGDARLQIIEVTVDTGTCEIECSDTLIINCQGSYLDCTIPAPTTTTTTTPTGTTTTTTTTTTPIPTTFAIALQPEGLLYTRSPIVYKYSGCETGRTYKLKLYTTTQETLTEYVTIERKADLLNITPGLLIDVSSLLTRYIRDNMLYETDNIIYFRLDALEYLSDDTLVTTITGNKLLAAMGYVDGGAELIPLKSGDIVTTTTTTPAPEKSYIDGMHADTEFVNVLVGGTASITYANIFDGGNASS